MVQPQPDGPMQFDMAGEEGGGALRVPPELAANEVVTRLLDDNQQLREALRCSNLALRQRCEEMEGWQRRTREEREFLSCRFQEARALVERLAQENHSLQGLVNGPSSSSSHSSSQTEEQQARLARNGPAPQTLDQRERKRVEEMDQHTQTLPPRSLDVVSMHSSLSSPLPTPPTSLTEIWGEGWDRKTSQDDSSMYSSLSSPLPTPPTSLTELWGEGWDRKTSQDDASMHCSLSSPLPTPPTSLTEAWGEGRDRKTSQPTEGGNEFLQLLKSHKEKMEEGMRELRRKNEELEKEREEGERDKDLMRRNIDQLRAKLAQAQACSVKEEAVQHRSEAQHSSDRYRELEEKLDYLQKSSAQRDRTEALLKQKDKDCAQLAKDCEALKAQATSLLGELKERQSCLEKSEHERKIMEEKLCSKMEALQIAERELEQQRKQHNVAVDKLLLQTQSLETALKTERHVVTEERKKLTQLQHAYTCLFRDYDSKLKNEGGDLCSRLEEAERALALKQDLIDKLKEEVEQQRGSLETVPVLTAQAEIYKADFLAEREAREKLHQRKEELQDQLSQALAENERLKQEGTSRARMEEMQQRHLEDFRAPRPPPPQAFNTAPPPSSFRSQGLPPGGAGAEELPDYRCPKCQYQAPDMDTLQIHVMDCIQ